jgi:hypothetical protein
MESSLNFVLFVGLFGASLILCFYLINRQFKLNETDLFVKPRITDLTGIYSNISLKPYGCFSRLDEKFFQKKINYSKNGLLDSGRIISDTNQDRDIHDLINEVIKIGFGKYGYYLINKFSRNYSGMDIKEIGILAKLAGYNYLSVYKLNETTRGKIYLSYSPPMNSQVDYTANTAEYNKSLNVSDLPGHTLTPKLNEFTNELENAKGKELACGYTCLTDGKPLVYDDNGIKRHYMCGSVGFPDIKTPTRFAVYQLV